jgi:hypothetical protein
VQPRLLAIDEIHHLLACTPREQRAALNILKFLSNQLRVSIVALGTSEALHVMRTDPQIASRFESHALPSWTANDDLRRFIAEFLTQRGVESTDITSNAVPIDYILELTSGVTGRIVELLRQSARVALARQTVQLSVADLQHAGKLFAADLGSDRNVIHLCHFQLIVSLTRINEGIGQQLVKLTRICRSRWAPRGVQRICCFLTNRLATS